MSATCDTVSEQTDDFDWKIQPVAAALGDCAAVDALAARKSHSLPDSPTNFASTPARGSSIGSTIWRCAIPTR